MSEQRKQGSGEFPMHPLEDAAHPAPLTMRDVRDFIHRALDDIANDNIGEAEDALHQALARIPESAPPTDHAELRERLRDRMSLHSADLQHGGLFWRGPRFTAEDYALIRDAYNALSNPPAPPASAPKGNCECGAAPDLDGRYSHVTGCPVVASAPPEPATVQLPEPCKHIEACSHCSTVLKIATEQAFQRGAEAGRESASRRFASAPPERECREKHSDDFVAELREQLQDACRAMQEIGYYADDFGDGPNVAECIRRAIDAGRLAAAPPTSAPEDTDSDPPADAAARATANAASRPDDRPDGKQRSKRGTSPPAAVGVTVTSAPKPAVSERTRPC